MGRTKQFNKNKEARVQQGFGGIWIWKELVRGLVALAAEVQFLWKSKSGL